MSTSYRTDGDLTLTVGQAGARKTLSGWQGVRVTRGIERLPSDFDIVFTERFPGEADAVVVKPGDPCEVKIGDDPVITGYVDRFIATMSPTGHQLRVLGRSKSQDLVDCSALWPNNQILVSDALTTAQKLAAPYGITVKALTDVGDPIPQFNLIWGETPYQIIERMARFRALLVYDDTNGDVILARVGSDQHASGLEQGKNIEAGSAMFGMDQRFSEYIVRSLGLSVGDLGMGADGDIIARSYDTGVPRRRVRYIIAESGITAFQLGQQRGDWEAARRAGRSLSIHVTTSSWRDGDGILWTPNKLVSVKAPALKVTAAAWVIAEVSYRRDALGTHADLTLMPPAAFQPLPFVWQPQAADIVPRSQQ